MNRINAEILSTVLGQRLRALYRYVLNLNISNDEFGHGISELHFENKTISIIPGDNEEYIIAKEGTCEMEVSEGSLWNFVDASHLLNVENRGTLQSIQIYDDGIVDIGLIFNFSNTSKFSIVLCDSDLMIGEGLEALKNDPEIPYVSLGRELHL